jgi:hypothetical protein
MTLDLDTFLVALYTMVDDLYWAHYAHLKPSRPGKHPELSDSEVLTLALCAQWFGPSERAFIRYVKEHWRGYFPRLLSQSAYNRRCRDLAGMLVHLVAVIAAQLQAYVATYQTFDTLPVPLLRRCWGQYYRLFGDEAAIGRGRSDKDWYYDCKLLVAVTNEGVITGFTLAPASTEDRWVAEAFLCWRQDSWATPGMPRTCPLPIVGVAAMLGLGDPSGPEMGQAPLAQCLTLGTMASGVNGGLGIGSRTTKPRYSHLRVIRGLGPKRYDGSTLGVGR